MGLRLERGLKHQEKAIEAINDVFNDVPLKKPRYGHQNPIINLESQQLIKNLTSIKNELPYKNANVISVGSHLNIDVKMETGTGKTYTYTQTIYELHKNYGLTKFVILVPTLAIKYGTTNFMDSQETKRHFRELYGTELEVYTLDAKKNKKENFPNAIREFVYTSKLMSNQISVLVTNMHLFKENSSLTKVYSSGVEGYYVPSDAISSINPVIIIDEPHRFARSGVTFKFIENRIKPQCIIRFGATFPELKGGLKDYNNLVYNLGSCDAFNDNLIKGVKVKYLDSPNGNNIKLRLKSAQRRKVASFELIKGNKKTSHELNRGDSLGLISSDFASLTVEGIASGYIELSNGLKINTGLQIYGDIYKDSYQEAMLKEAINSHFETEKENFLRNDPIKTLALFFIDDINSYRDNGVDKPYLKNIFEKVLKEKLEEEIAKINESNSREIKYKEYLQVSLEEMDKTHYGYFAKDNQSSDEAIADGIERILKRKEETLSLYYADGRPNTFRFIFSKWTLKEGWDNPNVFTIAKLRSSGSEISKLQEVGRGLRLPVNNSLSRVSDEQFYLNYIVDFTEKDFVDNLIAEVNGENNGQYILTKEIIEKVAADEGQKYIVFLGSLLSNEYIDENLVVNPEKRDEMLTLYPVLELGLKQGKIIDDRKTKMRAIKIKKENFCKLAPLWKILNQKYFLSYLPLDDETIVRVLGNILEEGINPKQELRLVTETLSFDLFEASKETGSEKTYTTNDYIKYNDFLLRFSKSTNVSIKLLHRALVDYSKTGAKIENNFFNNKSLAYFIEKFNSWKKEELFGRFRYEKVALEKGETSLTDENWNVKSTISQGLLGVRIDEAVKTSSKYLYDLCAYDSGIEKKNIMSDHAKIEVYGKIPQRSVRIPIIDGASYSPDFMYVIKEDGQISSINLIIESKGYDYEEDIPSEEKFKIKCAELFFQQLKNDGHNVEFKTQINKDKVYNIVNELIK